MPLAAGDSQGTTQPKPKDKGKQPGGTSTSGQSSSPSPALPDFDRINPTTLTPYVPPAPPKPTPEERQAATQPATGSWWSRSEALEFEPGGTPAEPERQMLEPTTREPKKKKKSYSMSWQDYRKLSDEQRAAVDFNTMLVEAREKDLNTEYAPSPAEKELYEQQVKDMFGDEGGSEVYAPETVAVLKQLDYSPQVGANKGDDLDDFLGLKVLIREKDLGKIDQPQPPAVLTAVTGLLTGESNADTRTELQTTMASSVQTLQESMGRGAKLLQNFRQWTAGKQADTAEKIGGDGDYLDFRPGFTDSKLQQAFDVSFSALAAPEAAQNGTWERIRQGLSGPGELAAFKKFAREALETPGYADAAAENGWMKPEEYRAMLKRLDKDGE